MTNTLKVAASANVFGAGLSVPPDPGGGGGGTLPSSMTLSDGATVITFSTAGRVTLCSGCVPAITNGPDGQTHVTDISSSGGISGIRASTAGFLTGVFLGNSGQSSNPPPTLDFSTSGEIGAGFTNLSPLLGQTFFLGDGLTGTGGGAVQSFHVPPGATSLYLGFVDGFHIMGPPGWYADNAGSFSVSVAQTILGTSVTNLLAYWTFDEGSGSIAYDSSGNSHTGTVSFGSTGSWSSGLINGAVSLDGDGAQVTVSNSPSLNPINGITIAAWVNDASGGWFNTPRILEKGKTDNQYALFVNSSGQLEFLLAGVSNGTLVASLPSSAAWHHLAATYDGSSLISLYIDGLPATQQVANGAIPITADPLAIGNKPGGNPLVEFNGLVDDVRIYGRALPPAEIATLYNTDSVGDGIPNWWRMQYFSNSSFTNTDSCVSCDADGTGQNNRFKYVAGLDPTDPTHVFVLNIASVTNQPQWQNLVFSPVVGGRTYTPQFSIDLAGGVWLPLPAYAGPVINNGNQATITDTNPIPLQEFYRIDISLP